MSREIAASRASRFSSGGCVMKTSANEDYRFVGTMKNALRP